MGPNFAKNFCFGSSAKKSKIAGKRKLFYPGNENILRPPSGKFLSSESGGCAK
jgi:hypothetical protein